MIGCHRPGSSAFRPGQRRAIRPPHLNDRASKHWVNDLDHRVTVGPIDHRSLGRGKGSAALDLPVLAKLCRTDRVVGTDCRDRDRRTALPIPYAHRAQHRRLLLRVRFFRMILQARCIPLHGAPDPDLRHELQRILYGLIPSRSWQQWAAPWPQPRRIELAYITPETAADHLGLAAPARVIAMRAQGEAEVAIEQGETRV